MKYYHEVKEDWLKARINYLTASDIKTLLVQSKTQIMGFPSKYFDVWSEKSTRAFDVTSYGAAARGHILEPIAIQEYNKVALSTRSLAHIDDVLITSRHSLVAFSPDALQFKAVSPGVQHDAELYGDVEYGGEVKCFSLAGHYKNMIEGHIDKDIQIQLATAFYILPNLQSMYLILFNPKANRQLHYVEVKRNKLSSIIDRIWDIEHVYQEFCDCMQESEIAQSTDIESEEKLLEWYYGKENNAETN
jgi:hypothetical protein